MFTLKDYEKADQIRKAADKLEEKEKAQINDQLKESIAK